MRGKGDICIAADTGVGITPAYAGKSLTMPENWTA